MKDRLTSRDLKAQETRRKLQEAARKLLSTTEYMNLRISDIAKAANVSVGTFYLYFPSKQAMIASQLQEINGNLSEMQPINLERSIEAQFYEYVDYYHQYMLRNGYMLSKALHTAIMHEGIDVVEAGVPLQYDYLIRLIHAGVDSGELNTKAMDAQQFIRLFFDTINGILFGWISSRGDNEFLKSGMENLKCLIRLMK